mgnify:CR=1 FL=1|tara:strand:- start:2625 stop:3608 length:984 start_codon:yes stop_codon:yes gene_type:complete
MEDQVTNPENQEVSGDNKTNMYDVMFGSATTNPEQSSTEQPQEEEEVILPEQLQEAEEDYDEVEEVEEIVEEEEIQETPQSYTVKVDGEEYEVDLDELRNGYQRQSDYTKKSQSVAEMRKAYEANLQSVQTERGQYQEVLANMENYQNLELQKFQELDWSTLKADDPVEYMEKRIEFQDAKDKVAQVRQERVNVQQKTQQEVYQNIQHKVQEEAQLLATALPEYSDPSSNLKDDLRNYAIDSGFTEQDVNAITDHKVVLMLHKAFLQDKASSSKTSKAVKKGPNKVIKAGVPVTKSQRVNRDVKAKRDRLRKTGSVKDATNAFLDLI